MSTLDPRQVFREVRESYSLAVASRVAAAVTSLNDGKISEAQAQRRINDAYANDEGRHVDPYRERVPADPHVGMEPVLRLPASATLPDVLDVVGEAE